MMEALQQSSGTATATTATATTEEWKKAFAAEWAARHSEDDKGRPLFPLAANPFGAEEVLAMAEVLLTGQLTLGARVAEAEAAFARRVGAPFAVMVNSGSSANLLAVAAVVNKLRPVHCSPGDQVLVPAVAWSTSVFPLLQSGLVPVFVDVDPATFNVSVAELERRMTPRVRAVMAVHVLGNATDMAGLLDFVRRHNLILVEDTCESLGSFCELPVAGDDDGKKTTTTKQRRMLGTLGDFGTFSFYFSHHITSGEGGMVVCRTEEDYNFVRCLRAHGWTRHLTNRQAVEAAYPQIDPRFLFVNVGYNLRPLEVQGAMLGVQLRRLEEFNACRRSNMARILAALRADPRFGKHMVAMRPSDGVDPAWFGLALLLHRQFAHQLRAYTAYLEARGIENRPIISGNFIRQPCIAAYCQGEIPDSYPGAEAVHSRGFFIGVHQLPIDDATVAKLVEIMLGFEFHPRHVVLVTGSDGMLGSCIHEAVVVAASDDDAGKKEKKPLPKVVCASAEGGEEAEWYFATLADGDLRKMDQVEALFKKVQPTRVLHCAAMLAAIGEMTAKPVEFWLDNVAINNNVLHAAHGFQTWVGPMKVLSVLSTVMFPRDAKLPVDASQILSGPPHPAPEAYAYAKRALAQLSQWYMAEHGDCFVTVLPGNFFGPHGNFDPRTAPLVNSLIAKAEAARVVSSSSSPAAALHVLGSGEVERQVMYARDLARVLLWALQNYDRPEPLIAAGEELAISRIAEVVCEGVGFGGKVEFDMASGAGPQRRTADTSLLRSLWPEFRETPLLQAIQETVQWLRAQHH